jgi:hypothetical protein
MRDDGPQTMWALTRGVQYIPAASAVRVEPERHQHGTTALANNSGYAKSGAPIDFGRRRT